MRGMHHGRCGNHWPLKRQVRRCDKVARNTGGVRVDTNKTNGTAPIDFESLVTRCLGDPQFAKAMLHLFATQAPEMVQAIEQSLSADDAVKAAKAAHALNGAAANLSAQPLCEVVAQIE